MYVWNLALIGSRLIAGHSTYFHEITLGVLLLFWFAFPSQWTCRERRRDSVRLSWTAYSNSRRYPHRAQWNIRLDGRGYLGRRVSSSSFCQFDSITSSNSSTPSSNFRLHLSILKPSLSNDSRTQHHQKYVHCPL